MESYYYSRTKSLVAAQEINSTTNNRAGNEEDLKIHLPRNA
jgi:hypothetical protein